MPKSRPTTLTELVTKKGSQDRAAHYLGVSLMTFRRWLKGKDISPMGYALLTSKNIDHPKKLSP